MAKLPRYDGNVETFAAESIGSERTVFGDTAQSDDINQNLNPQFRRGWGIVGPNDLPTKQDFNAMGWTLGQLISYLFQSGLAEWNDEQEYHQYSMVNVNGLTFYSLQNNNTGNNPLTETAWWAFSEIPNNWTATADPTVNDDATDGYMRGSKWFNTTTQDTFLCTDNTPGAAIWVLTSVDISDLGDLAFKDQAETNDIANGAVTNAKQANMPANTVKLRQSGAGSPQDIAMAAGTMLARLASGNIVAANASDIRTLLLLGTAALTNIGSGSGDVPTNSALGALAYLATVAAAQINDNAVTLPKIHVDAVNAIREVPQVVANANRTFVLTDNGKHVITTNTTSYTYTIPANADTAFPLGTIITVINNGSAGTLSLSRGAGVSLYMAGETADQNRALAARGMATLVKVATNVWMVSGGGLA